MKHASASAAAPRAGEPSGDGMRGAQIARWLQVAARRDPDGVAVVEPARAGWRRIGFAELDQRSDALAHGLLEEGLERGMRASLFLRPGIELVLATWACFKLGAQPVLIDPGMGARALARALERAPPQALLALPLGHALAAFFPRPFREARLRFVHGRFPGATPFARLEQRGASRGAFPLAETTADEPAAVLFTSGSTGPAKGVLYTQRTFEAQVRALGAAFGFRPGEVDLACFPLFALFDAAFGVTTVFPRLDPARPGRCDPEQVLAAIREFRPTTAFGSPAVWERVLPRLAARGEGLPGLERVITAGAPIAPRLVETLARRLDEGAQVFTPYGATEALPLSLIGSREILGETRALSERGAGTCVGRALPGIELALLPPGDERRSALEAREGLPARAVGEICARGEVVTREYVGDPAATRAAKIGAGSELWHRMGDLGWLDEDGRLWLVGRAQHRLETVAGPLYPGAAEGVFDLHPGVRRTALVGYGPRGAQRAALFVEPAPGAMPRGRRARAAFGAALVAQGLARFDPPLALHAPKVERVLFARALPVDPRHNAKIRRELLAERLRTRG